MYCNHKEKCTLTGLVFCIEEKITAHLNDEEIYGWLRFTEEIK